jgi:molybdate/tungstate transport system ATP-binding protein
MIQVQNICIAAGDFRLKDISFSVPQGSFGVLMGRTGSGKTTILECIIGLRKVASGLIRIGDDDITNLNPALRGIGYVPQDGVLFSKMTVWQHLAFALAIRRASAKQMDDRVAELAELLQITHLLKRKPAGLSGGESQRVALGRALSFRPKVLCLDEPLSALDSETRAQMCELLENVRRQTNVTTLHVTHNLEEAASLATCLFRLEDGQIKIEQPHGK